MRSAAEHPLQRKVMFLEVVMMLEDLIAQRAQLEQQLSTVKDAIREERKRLTRQRRYEAKAKAEKKIPANQRELDLHEKIRRIRVSAADALRDKGATWDEVYAAIGCGKKQIEEARANIERRDMKKHNVQAEGAAHALSRSSLRAPGSASRDSEKGSREAP